MQLLTIGQLSVVIKVHPNIAAPVARGFIPDRLRSSRKSRPLGVSGRCRGLLRTPSGINPLTTRSRSAINRVRTASSSSSQRHAASRDWPVVRCNQGSPGHRGSCGEGIYPRSAAQQSQIQTTRCVWKMPGAASHPIGDKSPHHKEQVRDKSGQNCQFKLKPTPCSFSRLASCPL
jgi:hypothetical protein